MEPIFKGGDRNNRHRYRQVGLLSQVRRFIDAVLDVLIRRKYTLHVSQYGFLKRISTHHAMLRLNGQARKLAGPLEFLDLQDAYPPIRTAMLLRRLLEVPGKEFGAMMSLGLLDGLRMVIGDDSHQMFPSFRGLTQGGRAACFYSVLLLTRSLIQLIQMGLERSSLLWLKIFL